MQSLKVAAIVGHNHHPMSGCIFQLLWFRLAQLAGISRGNCLAISLREELTYQNVYILVQINCHE